MLLKYLPEFMQDIQEIKEIMLSVEPEIENINNTIESLLKDFFILDSSLEATKHYENILKIVPKLTDDLKKRQYDILSVYNQTLPFTFETLKEKLNLICGKNGYTINISYDEFTLNIKLSLGKKEMFTIVDRMLENIVPVNLIIDLKMDYNVWKDLGKCNWENLYDIRWKDIKEEEKIKGSI